MSDARVEAIAAAIYPDVMETWQDEWPHWEYVDEETAAYMRGLARTALAALESAEDAS